MDDDRYAPAQGTEKWICWFLVLLGIIKLIEGLILQTFGPPGPMEFLVPIFLIGVGCARLKGWVPRGGGGGGGGP